MAFGDAYNRVVKFGFQLEAVVGSYKTIFSTAFDDIGKYLKAWFGWFGDNFIKWVGNLMRRAVDAVTRWGFSLIAEGGEATGGAAGGASMGARAPRGGGPGFFALAKLALGRSLGATAAPAAAAGATMKGAIGRVRVAAGEAANAPSIAPHEWTPMPGFQATNLKHTIADAIKLGTANYEAYLKAIAAGAPVTQRGLGRLLNQVAIPPLQPLPAGAAAPTAGRFISQRAAEHGLTRRQRGVLRRRELRAPVEALYEQRRQEREAGLAAERQRLQKEEVAWESGHTDVHDTLREILYAIRGVK